MTDYIVLAVPVFFALMLVEIVAVRLLQRDDYRLVDSIANLGCGVVDQLLAVFAKSVLFLGYLFVYEHRLGDMPPRAIWAWVLCFVAIDLVYYWFHRLSHEVSALWAAHVVHHQSEEYNLSVALRQGAFQSAFAWVFYLPLALLGFPPAMFVALSAANTLYQFWIHTRLVGRLGPFEWIFNTPSHHRVHHGRNPKYIDRNHAGVLIVWDRLFGTFQMEEEEPVYGVTTPLASWNPLWANFAHWVVLFRQAARTPNWFDKLRCFTSPPGWRPAELGGFEPAPKVERSSYAKFDTAAVAPGAALYAFAHFLIALGAASALLFRQHDLSRAWLAGAALLIAWSLLAVSALLESRPYFAWVEAARLLVLGLAMFQILPAPWVALVVVVASLGFLALILVADRHRWASADPS